MGVCNCSMYCGTLLYVHSSIAIILMGKRELIALLNLSSWCLVMVERLFLGVPRGCLQFVIVVLPDHTHLLFLIIFSIVLLGKINFIPFILALNSVLNDNQIVYLNKTDFEALYGLKNLYLRNNYIQEDTIEKGTFENCSSLIYL